jgi:hypothetical protein
MIKVAPCVNGAYTFQHLKLCNKVHLARWTIDRSEGDQRFQTGGRRPNVNYVVTEPVPAYNRPMAHFRPVPVLPSNKVGERGWAVERTALGELGGNVGPLYATRQEAKAEAARLKTQEPRTIWNSV